MIRLLLRLGLSFADMLLLAACFLGSFLLTHVPLSVSAPVLTLFQIPLFLFVAWLVLAWQEGLYRLELHDGWDLYFAALRTLLKSALLLFVMLFFSRSHEGAPQASLLLGLGLAFLLMPIMRVLLSLLIARLWPPCTLLVGNVTSLQHMFSSKEGRSLSRNQHICGIVLNEDVQPFFLDDTIGTVPPVLGKLEDVPQLIQEKQIDQILICGTHLSREELTKLLHHTLALGPRLFLLPDIAALDIAEVELGSVGGQPVLNFNQSLRSPVNAFLKRSIDLIGSTVGLLLLSPLFALLYILIRFDNDGPVFFRHRRIGRNMKAIHVAKFRTMVTNADEVLEKLLAEDPAARAEWEANLKLRRDPRVTRVGRFLRKTSLDELPQIWNVLVGDMSLVGPRPIVDAEVKKYGVWMANFVSVRPGMTGLWQVSGRNDVEYQNRVKLDMYYIRNWSIWLDFRIILRTLMVFFEGEGAY